MITGNKIRGFVHVLLILVGVMWMYPFIWMVTSAFKTNLEILAGGISPIPKDWQWGNFKNAWVQADFSGYFLNTVIITLATVVIVVVLSCMTGYALGRVSFRGRAIIIGFISALVFIPKGYTIIPLFELVHAIGLANSLAGVIFAESSGAHVLFILLFASFFSKMPQEMEDAAIVDGCGFFRTFIRVFLPLAKPVIATASIMQFIWTWGSFLIPLVLTFNKPELRTLAVGMQAFVGTYSTDQAGLAAGATIALIPVMLVFIFMQRFFIEGISGSVKQ